MSCEKRCIPVFGSMATGGMPMCAGGGWAKGSPLYTMKGSGEPGCGGGTIDTLPACKTQHTTLKHVEDMRWVKINRMRGYCVKIQ